MRSFLKKLHLFCLPLIACCLFLTSNAWSNDKIQIVATTSNLASLVREIGKDKVDVQYVASPKYNVHFFQARPSDVKKVKKADLYVNAGLDLEAWSDPLLEAAGEPDLFRQGPRNVDLSQGIQLINVPTSPVTRDQGDVHLFGNPHYMLGPENYKMMANTLAQKLKSFDPKNADEYEENKTTFIQKLDEKISQWKNDCSVCAGKEIISYHQDMDYLADFLGIRIKQYLEPKPGISPTPKHLQFLESYAKQNNVHLIVQPSYYPKNAAQNLANKVGAHVVVLAHNVDEMKGIDNLFDLFDFNVKAISENIHH